MGASNAAHNRAQCACWNSWSDQTRADYARHKHHQILSYPKAPRIHDQLDEKSLIFCEISVGAKKIFQTSPKELTGSVWSNLDILPTMQVSPKEVTQTGVFFTVWRQGAFQNTYLGAYSVWMDEFFTHSEASAAASSILELKGPVKDLQRNTIGRIVVCSSATWPKVPEHHETGASAATNGTGTASGLAVADGASETK
jgi:hypothetical protein